MKLACGETVAAYYGHREVDVCVIPGFNEEAKTNEIIWRQNVENSIVIGQFIVCIY